MTVSNHNEKLSYEGLVAETGYDEDQIYSELPSLIREYDINMDDVAEAITNIERERVYIGEVVYSNGSVGIDHTGTIDFDNDSWEYTGGEPLIQDAIVHVMSRWKAKEPVYDRHPLSAYDRERYTSILNKRRLDMFSNFGVYFAIGIENRGEESDPIDKVTESITEALSSGGSSKSAVYLSAYIRGHGGIKKISEEALTEGVETHQVHDPSEVLNGVVQKEGEPLRQAVQRRYNDYPLYPNKTPHVLRFRQLETDEISLPEPAVSVFEEQNVYSDDSPDEHVELKTIYTPEGFVPPIDRKLANEYRRSVGQGADPESDIDDLFRGSPTTHVGRASQLAGRFDQDEVTSQWTVQDRPADYLVVVEDKDPIDYPEIEVPVYIPDVEPEVLAKYLRPVTIDSYLNAAAKHDEGEIASAAIDEIVALYDIDRTVAEFCIEQFEASDHDGFYFR